jgi:enoyl-CoA hydratase/carnithine racemase
MISLKEETMAYETLIVEREENIAVITLNRPPANPVNLTVLNELEKVLNEFKNDKSVRAIIITGSGDRGFSAGFDLKIGGTPEGAQAMEKGQVVFSQIEKYPKPVIAAINGFALGGGCELSMACHFRIIADSEKVFMGQPEIERGIIPGWGGTQRLPRLVGKTKALEMMLTKISKPEELMKDAKEYAKAVAKKAPIAVEVILDAVTRGLEMTTDEGIKIELAGSQRVSKTKDAVEGIMAFIEKREANFIGE